jgi:predicted permease
VVDGEQIEAETRLVSGNYFQLLGATPRLGRGIVPEDEASQTTSAVVSQAFWMSAFNGDPRILERRLLIDGIEYSIAGVMPPGFNGHSTAAVDVWVPITTAMRGDAGWDQQPFMNTVSIVARLADGENVAAVSAQAGAALQRQVALSSVTGSAVNLSTRRVAFWLGGVSLLVLIIGLANAATLLLVRAARRRRTAAIRAALGASRPRLISQVAVEALLIATAGVASALLLGYWLDEVVRRVLLPEISRSIGYQQRTVFVALAAGLLTFGIATAAGAWSIPSFVTRTDFHGQSATRRSRTQKLLLVVQTGVCVMLLAGAGMFGRSLHRLMDQDFGMRIDDVLLVDFEEGGGPIPDQDLIMRTALDRVRSLPGVVAATEYGTLPFSGHHIPPISVPGRSEPPSVEGQLPFLIAATPQMFDILGISIVDGRPFTAQDAKGELVVIVNETMARATWPGERAVGKCIRIGFDPNFDPFEASGPPTPSAAVPCREVIGVARDVRQRRVVPTENEARLMQYFVPFSQVPGPPRGIPAGPGVHGLLVRTSVDPLSLIVPIRRLITEKQATLPYVRVRPYASLLERQVQPWALGSTLLTIFSALAVTVAAMGLFAAFAHAVTIRRREMAIRIAIGATSGGVVRMILREAAAVASVGIVLGAIAAIVGGRSLQAILFGIVPADPVVLLLATLGMLLIVLAATIVPARRAAAADPNTLLRVE